MARSHGAWVIAWAVGGVLNIASPVGAQPCPPRWISKTPAPDISGSAFEMAVFDPDGPAPTGPAEPLLVIAGLFDAINGLAAGNIAAWNNVAWSPLGTGTDGPIFGMTTFDADGPGPQPASLVVVGNFTTAGGVPALGVARWDGAAWHAIGSGIPSDTPSGPRCVAVFDADGPGPDLPQLYVGGFFAAAGPPAIAGIVRWNGTDWTPVGAAGGGVDLDAGVLDLVVFDDDGNGPHAPQLAACGSFSTIGGVSASRIARWNGVAWSPLGGGIGGDAPFSAWSMAVLDTDGNGAAPPGLYVAGEFGTADDIPAANIARWDTATGWSALSDGLYGTAAPTVLALAVFDDDGPGPRTDALYAAGRFSTAGVNVAAANIARWDGADWTPLGTGVDSQDNPLVYALAVCALGAGPPALFACGEMTSCGGTAVRNVARWNGATWSGLSPDLRADGPISALATIDSDGVGPAGPSLYIGGSFARIGGVVANNIVKNDRGLWTTLGAGLDGQARSMVNLPNAGSLPNTPGIAVGGSFTTAGGAPANNIAIWDGAAWHPLGDGVNGSVYACAIFDDDGAGPNPPSLYIGGDFTMSGARPVATIARWDGVDWQPVKGVSGLSGGRVFALSVFDSDGLGPNPAVLVAGGDFTTAEGNPAARIAQWNGTTWTALGGGVIGTDAPAVLALVELDETPFGMPRRVLVAGGRFTSAGGASASRVASWSGSAWTGMNGGLTGGAFAEVKSLAVYDDDGAGPGPATVYAGGFFLSPAQGIARWNGSSWGPVGGGLGTTQPVLAIGSIDRDRAGPIAPELYAAGGFVIGLRAWAGCDASCAGDFDRNGLVQPADVTLFVGVWINDLIAAGQAADMDNNGLIEPQDVALFVRAWFTDIFGGCQ